MSRARRIVRRLVPWVACFAGGWALAAWLLTDPYPAPWQVIAGLIAGVVLLGLIIADMEALDRRRDRRQHEERLAALEARYRVRKDRPRE